jgi:hypothetical protein
LVALAAEHTTIRWQSCLLNPPFSAPFCARGDYIRLQNTGNGPACRSVRRGDVKHGAWPLISGPGLSPR